MDYMGEVTLNVVWPWVPTYAAFVTRG